MIIYSITNKINNKQYIGKTSRSLNQRWKEHCSKNSKCPYLRNAIKKYGENNFEIKIIDSCSTEQEMNDLERHSVQLLNSKIPNGYNLTNGGDGSSGYKFSKEALKRLSESHKGIRPSKETLKKRSQSMKGKNSGSSNGMYNKKWTLEERKKKSEAVSGKNHPQYGVPKSDETKRKISLAIKGRIPHNKGKSVTKEVREKISKNRKGKGVGPRPRNIVNCENAVIDMTTGFCWNSIICASNDLNIPKVTLWRFLTNRTKNKTNLRYIKDVECS